MACPRVLAVVLGLVLAAPAAHAGCYRGRARPTRAAAELHWNHVPAKQLRLEDMPQEFTW
jgi:hypothetical protein